MAARRKGDEREGVTRQKRLDPKLDAAGWQRPRGDSVPLHGPYRTEEEETDNGPADYALWQDRRVVGVVEAKKLTRSRHGFATERHQKAHDLSCRKPLVDVISMVKHAAKEDEPLYTASERVEPAFVNVTAGKSFTPNQQAWLDRIRQVMLANLSIDREDFDYQDALSARGGARHESYSVRSSSPI
jgi:hypothetical protein